MEPLRIGVSGEGERAHAAPATASAQLTTPGDVRIMPYRLPGRDELDDFVRAARMQSMDSRLDPGQAAFQTHDVTNMAPPLTNYNLFESDRALVEAVGREGAGWAAQELAAFGELLGREETIELGFLANRNPPVCYTHDRVGRRRDEVEYHPAWHALLGLSVEHGLHASPWSSPREGAHVARAAGFFLLGQVEAGVMCPTTMTYAAVPALRRQRETAAEWEPRILSRRYDRRFRPAADKTGALIGMGMTEKQGGSDLRTNTTRAEPAGRGGPGGAYRLVGHKWFFSAPMSDAFLVTAQAPGGLSCFLLPRWTPDGAVNGIRLQRLKDKLGNRANASSEVEFQGAWAVLLGDEGRGLPTIMEMVNHTRLDCSLGSAALMRQALAQAVFHASHRRVFDKGLVEQPLMANVLADMAIESEAATALAFRLARAYDTCSRSDDAREAAWRRVMTPAIKYFTTKRTSTLVAEATEVFGGIGYVEESIMPRLYREAPLNSIWEGSGNVMCLDVRRALRARETADAVLDELASARGGDARLDRFVSALEPRLREGDEAEARSVVERLALAVAGSLLVRFAPHALADAFCASRLEGRWAGAFGSLPAGTDTAGIVRRASPGL
jgi:putative acyl-CoA dehydrogenase